MPEHGLVYQKALYYPYVTFPDRRWLATASLYWESIQRIVPAALAESIGEYDDLFVDYLKRGEPSLIEEIEVHPFDDSAEWASQRLGQLIDEARETGKQSTPIGAAINASVSEEDLTYAIYKEKIPEATPYAALVDRGLVRTDDREPDVLLFEPRIGQAYMALLALHLASSRAIPVITDGQVYSDLIRSEWLLGDLDPPWKRKDDRQGVHQFEDRLALLAMQTVVPDPKALADLSADQIIEFRRNHGEERRRFVEAIGSVADETVQLVHLDDEDALQDRLDGYEDQIRARTDALRDALQSSGIDTVTNVLSIDGRVPLLGAGASLLGVTVSPIILAVAGGGALALGVVNVRRKARARKAAKRGESAYSYLLDLEELAGGSDRDAQKPESRIERVMRRLGAGRG